MPEPTGVDNAAGNSSDPGVMANVDAQAATLSVLECLTKIAEHSRVDPRFGVPALPDHLMQELSHCVGAYAAVLRDLSTPPERAVVVVKRMITDTLGTAAQLRGSVTEAVVPRVIQAYFDNGSPQ